MERDPVCGMQVDPARAAAKSEHGGRTYFFCCGGCAQKFEAAPEKYLSPRPASLSNSMASGAVPPGRLLTVISPAAAARPQVAAIQPSVAAPPSPKAAVADYICPMDPEVHQTKPGACPKCGMALEAAVPAIPATKTEYVCPMHPADCAFGTGLLPDLRDGTGASGRLRGRRGESGADEHDAPFLG